MVVLNLCDFEGDFLGRAGSNYALERTSAARKALNAALDVGNSLVFDLEMDVKKALLMVGLAVFLVAGCAGSNKLHDGVRIDASSETTFNSSLNKMMAELSDHEKVKLQMALVAIMLSDVTSAEEVVKSERYKSMSPANFRGRFAGLSFQDILAKAKGGSQVQVMLAGDEPGVSDELLVPFDGGGTPVDAAPVNIAGSRWVVTSNINGHINSEVIEFEGGGKVFYVPVSENNNGSHVWEQSGVNVRFKFNDGYAVFLGTLSSESRMVGKAGNHIGAVWTWVAERQ